MTLNVEGFEKDLRDMCDYRENPYADVDLRLVDLSDEEKKACKEDYFMDLRIMKAKTYEELSDLTFKDVMKCFHSCNLFTDLFEIMKAKSYFDRFQKFNTIRTRRMRRIL